MFSPPNKYVEILPNYNGLYTLRQHSISKWMATGARRSEPPYLEWKKSFYGRNSGVDSSVVSPDINPEENVWTVLKNLVETKNTRIKAPLIATIQESEHEITLTMRQNLMNATTKRLQTCLARNNQFVHV